MALSHVMGLKANFGLRKPFSHLGISVLRELGLVEKGDW